MQKIINSLDDVISQEQDAYDNMPEGIRGSERGESTEQGLDNLNEAKDLIEETI